MHDTTIPQSEARLGADTLDGSPRRWYQPDAHALMARGFTTVDGLVTVSEFDRDYALRKAYQRPDRILALDNALPVEFLAQPIQLDRAPMIGFCGSWTPHKGTKTIVADMTRVPAGVCHVPSAPHRCRCRLQARAPLS